MKLPILTAAAFLLLGTTASMHARQGKQDDHSQEAKPAKQEAKPAAPRPQAKPAERQQTRAAKPEPQAKPAQQAKTAPQQQPKAEPKTASRTEQGNTGRTEARAPQSRTVSTSNGASEHGRISNDHYTASFGSGHHFHVDRGDYAHRRFQYGGYSFGFVDAWPIGWGYSDDVYVVYADGGYFMYDAFHPGLRISLSIL